ncbi:cytochrome c oxidase assembly protein [Rhodococcus erythropolis]|uniref:Cytochrome c oxidase assembly protein n=1 Tax=Rhodococcus erythropolis TaxID=1833 RepID=A0A8I0ZXT2_RHOER|nr:cytochrome c oxidase assembly protein [Rhodococcus erythropolis]MBH5143351.1 cytochrome c oxidase assembly protein [Rhodococcus erythropolis]
MNGLAPPSIGQMLTWDSSSLSPLVLLGAVLALWYWWSMYRVRARGRLWPWYRTACFLAGCLLLIAVTGSKVESYGNELFSVWMFQHLTLSMAIPPLWVLGSPGLLLLRSTSHRGPGRNVLALALSALRSRPAAGHVFLEIFFLASGLLFIMPVLATGPLPVRQSYLGRCFDLFVEMPLHVFIGVVLMMATKPLLTTFVNPPPEWGVDVMQDQQLAGALAWSYGEPVALVVVVIFAMRWNRDDKRMNAAQDRRAEIDGDSDLEAYNNFLRSLSAAERPETR